MTNKLCFWLLFLSLLIWETSLLAFFKTASWAYLIPVLTSTAAAVCSLGSILKEYEGHGPASKIDYHININSEGFPPDRSLPGMHDRM